MPWTERYFETRYLIMVICCAMVLVGVLIGSLAWLFKKFADWIHKKQEQRAKTLSDDIRDELDKW